MEYLVSEGGGVALELVADRHIEKKRYSEDDEDDEENLEEKLFDKNVRGGKVVTTRNTDYKDLRHQVKDPKRDANLIKARVHSRTPSANLKRRQSMRVRDLKIVERLDTGDIDIESDFVGLALNHHRYELRKTTPFGWEIIPNDEKGTITIKIVVDKKALGEDKDIEQLVLSTLKDNEAFKEFVDDLKSLEPHNTRVLNLYKLSSWRVKETSHLVTYIKVIRFGV